MKLAAGMRSAARPPMVCLYLLGASHIGPKVQQTVSVRLARREDIPGIQAANLKTLPENYATPFYSQHMINWPQLAFVAEATPVEDAKEDGEYSEGEYSTLNDGGAVKKTVDVGREYPISRYTPRRPQVVGYVLGRMETAPLRWPSDVRYTRQGHITSLAVLPSHRRHGLAGDLMRSVQDAMVEAHDAESASLHVRVSNEAALKLYHKSLGYEVKETIPAYYADGEDAYLMRNDLTKLASSSQAELNSELLAAEREANEWSGRPRTWVPRGVNSISEDRSEPQVAQAATAGL
eukprot:CAMPEP_0172583994 /NCGR_PEP_ID=MMETSP1068-20121228/3561_1 /TAXON_ID=35684 /ORGANISM="Pseudopedinella elastica, Strain CCMP716" /LENGTH=291 /DNA_ID=CAMNT_0013378003 /DNA_START=94 /DNA_END=969 /DNA_ORIENTATION=+